ncbi:MAG: pilus assembly PilX N-terminal domain-containing protein [Candidatus Pacebacteria bacterium]|nr:pilus assembly PilX N-terminal domain-containing protein [Candidatus Paceibacterota bacterium]
MIYKKNKKRINRENLRRKFSLKAKSYKLNTDRAFVSMIALMLANIFLIIGLSIFNIALRELTLSSGAKESLFAFYAADGGMECALYWDIQQNAFSTSTSPTHVNCSGQDAEVVFTTDDCGGDCRKNTFDLSFPSGSHAYIELTKESDGDTVIVSAGQNTIDPNNSRRVERAWRVRY